jgi:hypothetical protein
MKTLLLSVLALTVAAAPVFGEDEEKPKPPKNRPPHVQANRPQHVQAPPQRQVNQVPKSYTPRVQQQLNAKTQAALQKQAALQNKPSRNYTPKTAPQVQNQTRTFTPPNQDAPRTVNPDGSANKYWQNRNRNRTNRNVVTNQTPDTTVRPNPNTTARNRDWRNRTNTNRNWQNNNRSNTFTYQQARSRFNRQHHDRSWWRSHYSRIALFAGGYYYWNDGYWFPAYGYDPYYTTYSYDEPIYGYNNLDPGQVIVNVQSALQEQGYYRDEVDGLIGPNTRAALSNYQRDHGLPVTAAIDGPTLEALGLS